MHKKKTILAVASAAAVVAVIVLVFVFTRPGRQNQADGGPHSSSAISPASGASEGPDETEPAGTNPDNLFMFDPERVAQMRTALIDDGYKPVNVEHIYEGCELFARIDTPAGMDVPPEDIEGAEHIHPGDGFEPYVRYALLTGDGVRMAAGDLVFDVNILSNIRRADNGERLYTMISEEQAETAEEMWAAAEQIREAGSHPDQENAIILNGRMVSNAGFVIQNDVIYLPIEKLAKMYFPLAEVNEGRWTIIRIDGRSYTFYGDKLSDGKRDSLGITNRQYTMSSPLGMNADEGVFPLYTTGGYIELDALSRALGWGFELHDEYIEIVSDPLDVNKNFVVLPDHDMITLDRWFLENSYTLYGWDNYTPKFN